MDQLPTDPTRWFWLGRRCDLHAANLMTPQWVPCPSSKTSAMLGFVSAVNHYFGANRIWSHVKSGFCRGAWWCRRGSKPKHSIYGIHAYIDSFSTIQWKQHVIHGASGKGKALHSRDLTLFYPSDLLHSRPTWSLSNVLLQLAKERAFQNKTNKKWMVLWLQPTHSVGLEQLNQQQLSCSIAWSQMHNSSCMKAHHSHISLHNFHLSQTLIDHGFVEMPEKPNHTQPTITITDSLLMPLDEHLALQSNTELFTCHEMRSKPVPTRPPLTSTLELPDNTWAGGGVKTTLPNPLGHEKEP